MTETAKVVSIEIINRFKDVVDDWYFPPHIDWWERENGGQRSCLTRLFTENGSDSLNNGLIEFLKTWETDERPALVGSEKQVKWARDIRYCLMKSYKACISDQSILAERLNREIFNWKRKIFDKAEIPTGWYSEKVLNRICNEYWKFSLVDKVLHTPQYSFEFMNMMESETDAKTFIDKRDMFCKVGTWIDSESCATNRGSPTSTGLLKLISDGDARAKELFMDMWQNY